MGYGGSTYAASSAMAGAVASSVSSLINIAILVLVIVARWQIFKKAGQPGWAAIIPFYSDYVLYKIAGRKTFYWIVLGMGIVIVISYVAFISIALYALGGNIESLARTFLYMTDYELYNYVGSKISEYIIPLAILLIVMLVLAIAALVLEIMMYVSLSKSFGKGGGFACGLIFLSPIFMCILAFSRDIYYIGNEKYDPYGRFSGNQYNPYGQQNMYNQQNPYGQQNMYNQQNPYGQQNPYNQQNPYGQQDMYNQQNPYGQQDMYNQQNPYSQQDVYNQQNQYSQQDPYAGQSINNTQNSQENQTISWDQVYGDENVDNQEEKDN